MARGHKARHGVLALGFLLTVAVVGATFGGASTASPAAPAAVQKAQLPMKTIGVMGPVDAAEIIKLSTDATIAADRALGWKTMRVDPGGDPAKMASGMTSLVNARVDAIVLTTIEPATIASGLRAAKARDIPVIDTHTKTQSSALFAGEYFLPPRTEFNLLLARMKRDLPRGSEIGTLNLPQFLNAKLAGDYIKQAARANGWKIVASHDTNLQNLVPDAQRAAGDMIRANPGIDAIFGCCDFAPAGAVPAIRASWRRFSDVDGEVGPRGARGRRLPARRDRRDRPAGAALRDRGGDPQADARRVPDEDRRPVERRELPVPDGEGARAVQGEVGAAVHETQLDEGR